MSVEEIVKVIYENRELSVEELVKLIVKQIDISWKQLMVELSNPHTWKDVLDTVYELTSPRVVEKSAITLTTELDPNSIVEAYVDLTDLNLCCICPTYYAASTLSPIYARLSILVNDKVVPGIEEAWLNKYIAYLRPITNHLTTLSMEVLSERWGFIPKATIRIYLYNLHDTDVGKFYFYTECLQMRIDDAVNLVKNFFEKFIKVLETILTTPKTPIV